MRRAPRSIARASSRSRRSGWRCCCRGGGPLDRQIYEALYAGHRPALLAVARVLHRARRADGADRRRLRRRRCGCGAPGIAACRWCCSLIVARSAAASSEVQKYWIARVRPDLEPHLVVVKTSSFPSGHATSSMIFYLTLALALTAGTRWHRPAAARRDPAVAADRHQPGDARRPLAERRDRRLGVRAAVGAADAAARRAAAFEGVGWRRTRGGANDHRPFT